MIKIDYFCYWGQVPLANQRKETPADDVTSQNTTDCENFTLTIKMQNLLSSEERI